jgi:hypothetical protein
MPASPAVIVVLPVLTAVANPVLLIVATLDEEDDHVTDDVMSFLELSPKVPVAVNCWVLLLSVRVELLGDMEIATNVEADGKNCPQLVPSTVAIIRIPTSIRLENLALSPQVCSG